MLTLPNAIVPVLNPFATPFRNPTWLKAQILLVGAILAPGQRTVAVNGGGMLGDWGGVKLYHLVCKASEKVRAN